jgi:hypothetical protein
MNQLSNDIRISLIGVRHSKEGPSPLGLARLDLCRPVAAACPELVLASAQSTYDDRLRGRAPIRGLPTFGIAPAHN